MSAAAITRLLAMIRKELLAVLRDPKARITLVVPPIMQLLIFGFAATLEVKNFDVGLLNRDSGAWSREYVSQLAGSPNVREIVILGSERQLERAIDRQEVIAAISIPADFSARVATHRPATIQLILDGRRSNAAQIVASYLDRISRSVGAGVSPRAPPPGQSLAVNLYNPNLDYLWFTMPALIVMIGALSALSITAQSVARERELGTFDQLLVSPLRVHEILIGKMVPPVLVGLFNATLYIFVTVFVFGVPLIGSLMLFYLALVPYLVSLVGVGMLVSAISRTQQQAFLGMFLSTVPMILLSGFASPVDNMPDWLRLIAELNPLKHFLVVSEGIFLKGLPADAVWANSWPLLLIAILTTGASAALFRSRLE